MKIIARHLDLLAAAYLNKPKLPVVSAMASLSGRAKPEPLALVLMEHNELFMVPGTPRYAPPYESLIREGRMGGKATSQARDIFSSAGFDIKTLDAEPHLSTKKHHDHLGFGLAFTSAMLWRSMLRPSEAVFCMRTACEFFEQRIAPWAPEYGRRLAGLALTKHFADLGQFTAGLDKLVPELCRDRKHHKSFSREPVPA